MGYFEHFKLNISVAARCLVMALFHAAHAIVPSEITSHEFWGIRKGGR